MPGVQRHLEWLLKRMSLDGICQLLLANVAMARYDCGQIGPTQRLSYENYFNRFDVADKSTNNSICITNKSALGLVQK